MVAARRPRRAAAAVPKAKAPRGAKPAAAKPAAAPKKARAGAAASRVVEIEHCKSWGAFKTRAAKLVKYVAAHDASVKCEVNVEKPRRGFFEVRVGGEPVLSLGPMARPFPKLKALDMDEVGAQVMAALK